MFTDELDLDMNYDEATMAQVEMIQKEVCYDVPFLSFEIYFFALRFKRPVSMCLKRKTCSH